MGSIEVKNVDKYLTIDIDILPTGVQYPCNIYFFEEGNLKELINKGNPFTPLLKSTLKSRGISKVHIKQEDRKLLYNFIQKTEPDEFFNLILERYRIQNELYFKIEREILNFLEEIPFDIFLYNGQRLINILNANSSDSSRFDKNNIPDGDILIKKTDLHLYQELLSNLLVDKDKKSVLLKEHAKIILRDIYSNPFKQKTLTVIAQLVDDIIEYIDLETELIDKFSILKKHDNYSYVHSLNVTTLSIALGIKAGLDSTALKNLGMASVLHDIGKINISPLILSKIGNMTSTEYEVYKTHVFESTKIASKLGVSEEIQTGILHHHEKINGRGYPKQLNPTSSQKLKNPL